MLGEQLLMSLKVIVLGMGTVFIALISLIYVIELINKVLGLNFRSIQKASNKIDDIEEPLENKAVYIEKNKSKAENRYDDNIVAVITAAIAASLDRSTHDIVVKKIRRVADNTPAWNRAGRQQNLAGRL